MSFEIGYYLDEASILYCTNDLASFLQRHVNPLCTVRASFLLPTMYKIIEGTLYVTEVGLKHAFSVVIGTYIDRITSDKLLGKFANGLIRTSLDNTLSKQLGLNYGRSQKGCNFCSLFEISNQESSADAETLTCLRNYFQHTEHWLSS